MKLIFLFSLLLLAACQESFKNPIPVLPPVINNPEIPPVVIGEGKDLFAFEDTRIYKINKLTGERTTVAIHGATYNYLQFLNPRVASNEVTLYFYQHNPTSGFNELLAFDTVTHEISVIETNYGNYSGGLANVNSLLTFTTDSSYSMYTHDIYVGTSGPKIAADTYYGLDGVVNTTSSSSACHSIGNNYSFCLNGGTNSKKLLVLKAGSNPGFRDYTIPNTFSYFTILSYHDESIILSLSSGDTYRFNYADQSLLFLGDQNIVYNSAPIKGVGHLLVSRNSGHVKFSILRDNATSAIDLYSSTDVPGGNEPLNSYIWSKAFTNSDKSKVFVVGYDGDYELGLLELSADNTHFYQTELYFYSQSFFMFGNKLYSINDANKTINEVSLSGGTMTYVRNISLENKIKSAACLAYDYPSTCSVQIENGYNRYQDLSSPLTGSQSSSMWFRFTIEGVENSSSNNVAIDEQGNVKVIKSTDPLITFIDTIYWMNIHQRSGVLSLNPVE